ncbi:MAG: pitrilysin family protein [Candidatus Yanofskybacteria bacterium]|nr:pitrilysin family protein [Candidatus Yanofskybacteria bacterium]
MVKKTTFKSGLRVLTIPQRGTGAVTVLVLVKTGSKYEERRINGISHFLEHMFFKGTKKRPEPIAIPEAIDKVGGYMNAFTGEDYTGYYVKVSAAKTALALDVVSDILCNSLLSAKEIEKEKGVIIEEINMYRDTPNRHIYDLFQKLLYGDQPAGWNIAGSRESVLGLYRSDLLSYMNSQYIASKTVVCVAGNIEEEKVIKNVGRMFSHLPRGDFLDKQPVVEAQKKPQLLLETRKIEQTQVALGARGVNLADPRRFDQELLASHLGGMMSSKLFVEVREKLGLVYDISTSSESNPDTGYIVTTAGVKHGFEEKAITTILREYKKLKSTLLSEQELNKVKEHEMGKLSLRLETSNAQANFYGMQELLEERYFTPQQVYDKIQKVRATDIRLLAKQVFRPENLNLAVLGNFRDRERFRKLLSV